MEERGGGGIEGFLSHRAQKGATSISSQHHKVSTGSVPTPRQSLQNPAAAWSQLSALIPGLLKGRELPGAAVL